MDEFERRLRGWINKETGADFSASAIAAHVKTLSAEDQKVALARLQSAVWDPANFNLDDSGIQLGVPGTAAVKTASDFARANQLLGEVGPNTVRNLAPRTANVWAVVADKMGAAAPVINTIRGWFGDQQTTAQPAGGVDSGSIAQKTALYQAAVARGNAIIGDGYGEQYARLLQHESDNFAPDVLSGARKSSAGAVGIAQFMPATAAGLGVDPLDIEQSIDGGAYYLKQQLNNFGGDMRKALAAYNSGPGTVQRLVGALGAAWETGLPAETKQYLQILGPPAPGDIPMDPSIVESGRQFDASQALRLQQFQQDVRQFGADEAYRRDALRQGADQSAASLAESRRQFNTTFGLNEAALTGVYGGSPTENARQFDALFGENARQFDQTYAQNGSQFDARLAFDQSNTDANRAESARQANLGAVVTSNGQQMAALPQFGQLALQGSEQVRDILSNGKDSLYRAYRQRGESSPAGLVTQADQINQLLRGFDTIASRVPAAINPTNPTGAAPVAAAPVVEKAAAPAPQAGFVIGTQPAMAAVQGQSGLTPAEAATRLQEAYSRQGFTQQPVARANGGPVSADGVAVVGEEGPEVVIDTPEGFVVKNREQLGFDPMELLKHGVKGMSTGGIDWGALLQGGNQQVTQEQLNQYGAAFLAPGARDTLVGKAPKPIQSPDFKAFTPQQLMALDETEKGGLDTYLQNKFQTSLGDAEFQTKQLFGPANRRDAPRVRGFSL